MVKYTPMAESSSLATLLLKSAGIYSDEQLSRISNGRAANPGMGLAEAAVKFGGHKEPEFLEAVGRVLGLEVVDLERRQPNPDALTKLPASAVYQYNVLPVRFDGGILTVVSADPFSTVAGDGLRLAAGCPVKDRTAGYIRNVTDGFDGSHYEPDLFSGLWEFSSFDETLLL